MKHRFSSFVVALLVLVPGTAHASDIVAVTVAAPSIDLDGRLEARIELGQAYENPFS